MNLRIVVTGGSGMVGRNFREAIAIEDSEVFAPTHSELDLTDYASTLEYLQKVKPAFVVHAAGHVGGIQANISSPVRFLVANMDMGRNIVVAAREAEIPRLLNLGSSCMYPRNSDKPLKEEMVLNGELEPSNEGYAIAKCAIAKLCGYISQETPAYSYKTLIPCNIYGPHDNFSPTRSHMIPAAIHKIHMAKASGEDSVNIWGDGKARREFMYSGDLASAMVWAIEHFDILPNMLNVGIGQDYTIDDYYQTIALVVGWKGTFVHDMSKPSGMLRKLVDTSRIEALGWKHRTSLVDGITKTYKYYLEEYEE